MEAGRGGDHTDLGGAEHGLFHEIDGSVELAFCFGAIEASLIVEGDERRLHSRYLDRYAVFDPDVEGQKADAAAGELREGLACVGIHHALVASLAHRLDVAVLVEVSVSRSDGHGASGLSRRSRRHHVIPGDDVAELGPLGPTSKHVIRGEAKPRGFATVAQEGELLTSRRGCGALPYVSRRVRTVPLGADGACPIEHERVVAPAVGNEAGEDADRIGREHPGPASDASPLPLLPRDRTLRGTVWIPRILWALEWGRREGRPPLSAADIARVLTEHGGLELAGHNVARAFRDYRNDAAAARLWVGNGRGYAITVAGTRALETLLADEGRA